MNISMLRTGRIEGRTSAPGEGSIVTVRPTRAFHSKQGLPNFDGISAETAGAKGLCMHMMVFPPGAEAVAHSHDGFETAIYVLEGQVECLYGEGLRHKVVNGPGDFIFIPPNVPHKPRNLSATSEARAIVSRNDPNEQESVMLYAVPNEDSSSGN